MNRNWAPWFFEKDYSILLLIGKAFSLLRILQMLTGSIISTLLYSTQYAIILSWGCDSI